MRKLILLVPVLLTGCAEADNFLNKSGTLSADKEANLAAAARVDQIGRQVLAANPFVAQDVAFRTVGSEELAVFHRDRYSVYITDGLVQKCKTDGELAAVLCTELGNVVAEQRNAARMGVREAMPFVPTGAGGMEANGIPADQSRLAELGFNEQRRDKAVKEKAADPKLLAADFLKAAGYEEDELKKAEPLLKSAETDSPLVRQLSGVGDLLPSWSK